MVELVPQASFNSGEWAPSLYARVDLQKYRSGAALLENFYVDYRGGASTRPGTRYILQAYKSATAVRLIPFKAAFNIGYILEFGQNYIRFYYQGSPVLETAISITSISNANPGVVTAPSHGYATGDWVYIASVSGMTQINERYFQVGAVTTNTFALQDLNGNALNTATYSPYTTGGTTQRIYTLASPYAAADLAALKFAQVPNEMVLCNPNYVPYLLTLVSATDWTLEPITIGSTIDPPTGVSATTTLGAGSVNYSYVVTSIDSTGQESEPSVAATINNVQDISTTPGSNQISWSPVSSAEGYNVYSATVSYFGAVPPGVNYGYIGNTSGTTFIDTNITADFSESPPIAQDPFVGSGISFITMTAFGSYTTPPTVSFSGGSPTIPAQGYASLGITSPTIAAPGTGYEVGDTINFGSGVVMTVTAVSSGNITAWTIASRGSITSGTVPGSTLTQVTTSGSGSGAELSVVWGVTSVVLLVKGAGYNAVPTVSFSSGAATATATLAAAGYGNPTVPSFFQQRLVLAAQPGAPQTLNLSQPGNYFNFDITSPSAADNAIAVTLVSGSLQTIQSIVSVTSGMAVLTDSGVWLVNGGSSGSAVSPSAIVANFQSSFGANAVPPIIANYDALYVSAKGAAVRDLAYNIYFNVFTGSDISAISSHLFYGYTITEWAWAEQPFYVAWAIRNDGVMLTLTFLKEQEFIGWSHQVTQGSFVSVATVTETTTTAGYVDAVYTAVERTVNGYTVKYIERVAERAFPNGLESAWTVDSALNYTGAATLNFTGAENLAGLTVTGLATDNLGNTTVIAPFAMPITGFFTLPAPIPIGATGYTNVTIGLGFTCQLQTLAIDTSQPPIQGKLKRIPYVDVRVNDTLGLQIGTDFNNLVPMKDTITGNVSSMATGLTSQIVTGLYSGDARTFLNPSFNVYGQYAIQQSQPLPATVLGVFPCLQLGDSD